MTAQPGGLPTQATQGVQPASHSDAGRMRGVDLDATDNDNNDNLQPL